MKKYLIIMMILTVFHAEGSQSGLPADTINSQERVRLPAHLSSLEFNVAHEDYDKICDELPSKPMSRWQIMLARVGTPMLTTYIAVKRYIIRQLCKWHLIQDSRLRSSPKRVKLR